MGCRRVREIAFKSDKFESSLLHEKQAICKRGLTFVQGLQRNLSLDQFNTMQDSGRSFQHLGFKALDIQLKPNLGVRACHFIEDSVESLDFYHLGPDIARIWEDFQVSGSHRQKGAALAIGGGLNG